MARKKTLSMLNSKLDEKMIEAENLNNEVKQELVEKKQTVQKNDTVSEPRVKQTSPATRTQKKTIVKAKTPAIFQTKKSKAGNVNKTFRVNEELIMIIEDVIRDPETKKIAPNMFGVMSKIVNNGLIREMVELGLVEESYLDQLEEY